jgi:hypothetical protein
MQLEETNWFPGTEKPGEDGLYKRRKVDQISGERGPVMYCLWSDGWWYEGSEVLTSALNEPLRKSHYQPGHWEDFEWCGLMPGAYERPDVQAVKTENFVGGFFGDGEIAAAIQAIKANNDFESKLQPGDVTAAAEQAFSGDNQHPESIVTERGQQQMLDLALEEPVNNTPEANAQFAAGFFGGE